MPISDSNMPTSNLPTVVLASGSRYRATLLRKILPEFDIAAPDVDETPLAGESALVLAERLAALKAQRVASNYSNALIIGSDQVAVLNNSGSEALIMGKPGNFDAAYEQLSRCSGQTVSFITAVAIIDTRDGTSAAFADTFSIKFRQLDKTHIRQYLHREKPFDCAGSIKTEALGITLIEKFIGDDPNTLIGLPLIKVIDALHAHGVNPLNY
jgi:MAF protein